MKNNSNKKNALYYICIILVLAFSCSEKNSESFQVFDLGQNHNISIHDVFSDIDIVQLETSKECFITTIHKVEYHYGHYYIFDLRGQEVLCFDDRGKFVFKISDAGKGPNEYVYISDFTIDKYNNQILLLVPQGKLHIYNLTGDFVKVVDIRTDNILSFNWVYSIDAGTLLFTSISEFHLLFYSIEDEKVFKTEFQIPTFLQKFSPYNRIAQYDGKTLCIPALSQEVYDISSTNPLLFYNWNFGTLNNSGKQINKLINELSDPKYFNQPLDIDVTVKDKKLNQYILQVIENKRYRMAIIETGNDFKYAISDKVSRHSYVFSRFNEGIGFYYPDVSNNSLIVSDKGFDFSALSRDMRLYDLNTLSHKNQEIIKNHNPEVDNPFLIIYRFRTE